MSIRDEDSQALFNAVNLVPLRVQQCILKKKIPPKWIAVLQDKVDTILDIIDKAYLGTLGTVEDPDHV